jgi:hypothetical protein
MKNLGGRPSKYREIFVEEVDKYIKTTGREQTELPTKQGLALWFNVDENTLNSWGKKHKRFFSALNKLMLVQAKQLINDGIYGGKDVNSTIVKLLLQNNHGMKERTDTTTDDKPLPAPIYNGKSTNSTDITANSPTEAV